MKENKNKGRMRRWLEMKKRWHPAIKEDRVRKILVNSNPRFPERAVQIQAVGIHTHGIHALTLNIEKLQIVLEYVVGLPLRL